MNKLIIISILLLACFSVKGQIKDLAVDSVNKESQIWQFLPAMNEDFSFIRDTNRFDGAHNKMNKLISTAKIISHYSLDSTSEFNGTYSCEFKLSFFGSKSYRGPDFIQIKIKAVDLQDTTKKNFGRGYASEDYNYKRQRFKLFSENINVVTVDSIKVIMKAKRYKLHSKSERFYSFGNGKFLIYQCIGRREGGATYWTQEHLYFFKRVE